AHPGELLLLRQMPLPCREPLVVLHHVVGCHVISPPGPASSLAIAGSKACAQSGQNFAWGRRGPTAWRIPRRTSRRLRSRADTGGISSAGAPCRGPPVSRRAKSGPSVPGGSQGVKGRRARSEALRDVPAPDQATGASRSGWLAEGVLGRVVVQH